MMLIISKNLSEDAFYKWISGDISSFHWCDMNRFYTFVKTVLSTPKNKFREPEYLKKRIQKAKPFLKEDVVETYIKMFIELRKFYCAPTNQRIIVRGEKIGCLQRYRCKNGDLIMCRITEKEYFSGGISVKEMKNRKHDLTIFADNKAIPKFIDD